MKPLRTKLCVIVINTALALMPNEWASQKAIRNMMIVDIIRTKPEISDKV